MEKLHKGITPGQARVALIRARGSYRGAARDLGCSDSTIRWHLRNAPALTLTVAIEGPQDEAEALRAAIRDILPVGVTLTA